MPDFKAYVRSNLRLQKVSGAREAEIVEEIALDLEERYQLKASSPHLFFCKVVYCCCWRSAA